MIKCKKHVTQLEGFRLNLDSKDPKINLMNFPFCFVPMSKYRYLYSTIIRPLKGDIGEQRYEAAKLQHKSYRYLKACLKCRSRVPCYTYSHIKDFSNYEPYLKPRTQSTIAFVGGSLSLGEYMSDSDIFYAYPVEQGDIFMAVLEGFKNILIIDGYFYTKFPCTTFEILLALELGINVFGSSSIGALRAVELDRYGMAGVGYVYDYLKKKRIKPYHIVAQVYDENNKPLTVPLINIIYFLESALKKDIVNRYDLNESFKVANNIHFTSLTFAYFFRCLRIQAALPKITIDKMEAYLLLRGEESFNIKRKDALQLLKIFRRILDSRDKDYVKKTFNLAKKKCLSILYRKYRLGYDLTLPKDWGKSLNRELIRSSQNTRNNRERLLRETLKLAGDFFKDLDVVIADVSKYEHVNIFIINIFFISLYFFEYYLSCASGNGNSLEESLVCAYMELLERIPMFFFPTNSLSKNEISGEIFPYKMLPQFYNLDMSEKNKQARIKRYGYVRATEILNNREVFIPKYAAMALGSGTDGNASGNSFSEAILYGIYELIERDTSRIYEYIDYRLQSNLVIDSEAIKDTKCLSIIEQFKLLGCNIFLLDCINVFNVPCIRCLVLDLNHRIVRHGSTVARIDYNAALFEAVSEAYMLYMTYFTGSRDDYTTASNRNANAMFYLLQRIFSNSKHCKKRQPAIKLNSIKEELDLLTERINNAGIGNIIVVNNSPRDKYLLKSVKVIMPGAELYFINPYRYSPWFDVTLKQVLSRIHSYVKT